MLKSWQVDNLWEASAAEEWERINEPDPNENRRHESSESLDEALKHLDKAWDWIYQAVDDVNGLPIADKIESLEEEVLSIQTAIRRIQDELK